MSWEEKRIGEVCTLNYGKNLPKTKRQIGKYPVYSSAGLIDYHSESLVDKEGIIIGRKGSVGTVFYSNKPFFPIDTSYYVLPSPSYNLKFLYYNLQTCNLERLNSDAAVPGLNRENAYSQRILMPPISEQKKIASILSTYDDLIENNHKRIKLLEEAAQRIYKEWFVDFKFPNHKNTPINPETGLPEGWEKKELQEIADVKSSKRIFKSDYVEKGVLFYRGKEITLLTEWKNTTEPLYISQEKFQELKEKFGAPVEGDILITSVGTIGNAYRVTKFDGEFYFKDGNLIWINNIKPELSIFLINFFKSAKFKSLIKTISIGSSQKAFTISSIRQIKIDLPSIEILEAYYNIINEMMNQQNVLMAKMNILREAREMLLPRLMNRTIEV